MNNPERLEELAALRALGLLDEAEELELITMLKQDPALASVVHEYAGSAAALAYFHPEVEPPAHLKRQILSQLDVPGSRSKIIAFPSWIPFALAAGLMFLALYQARSTFLLRHQIALLHHRNSQLVAEQGLQQVEIAELAPQNSDYTAARVIVVWDARHQHGVISLQNLPDAPAEHDYQLWILDPAVKAPLDAGVLPANSNRSSFTALASNKRNLNFAISLEPRGGRPSPTGPILFASSNK